MLVQVPNKSTFLGPMQLDPLIIREKLFQGIDGDYNVTNMGIVVEVIGQLENSHITREELEATRLGKHVNELRRKASDKLLASRAKSLIKKWKSLLPTPPVSGPPPGGGNNNNSTLANGNTGSRLHHPAVSPRLVPHPGQRAGGPTISPRLPPISPRLSQGGPRTPLASPMVSPRTPLQSPRLATNSPRTLPPTQPPRGQVRTVPPSPSLPRSGLGTGTRTSPVLIASSTSTSPSRGSASRPVSPATVDLESRDASPHPTSRSPSPEVIVVSRSTAKRPRPREDSPEIEIIEAKKVKLTNGDRDVHHTVKQHSDKLKPVRRKPPPRSSRTDTADILNQQMLKAKLAGRGKVRTTQELVQNLGIESRAASLSPPSCPVTDLVPKENQAELMNRFFLSQNDTDILSRPSTAASEITASSELTSAAASRVASPLVDTVEDLMAQLPVINCASVMEEWYKEQEEEEEEVEGLIPVLKTKLEVTQQLIYDLNNGQLEHIGGIKDHEGEFREWHEMTSLMSKDGELLHILPYSVID